jgi:hypothetical protein
MLDIPAVMVVLLLALFLYILLRYERCIMSCALKSTAVLRDFFSGSLSYSYMTVCVLAHGGDLAHSPLYHLIQGCSITWTNIWQYEVFTQVINL